MKKGIRFKELLRISFRSLLQRKTRVFFTILAMGLGVGILTFLLSLGYGIQNLIITQIASLKSLKIIDVSTGGSRIVKIDDKTIKSFSKLSGTKRVIPIISLAGRIFLEASSADIIVYGVPDDYFSVTDIHLLAGRFFKNENSSENEVVINDVLLSLFNWTPQQSLGKKIKINFILTKMLNEEFETPKETPKKDFKIIGVVREGTSPQVYLPLKKLKEYKIKNYLQVKIEAEKEEFIPDLRKKIEHMGYETTSVLDTISQINRFFRWGKIGLAIFGGVILLVAVLGMFNTLTVSLLEKTKEVGIMKALGMKRREVALLFLTEAGIMGLSGGILGVLFAFVAGKILEIFLNIFFVAPEKGFVEVTLIPIWLAFLMILLSFIVSLLTGIFPAKRAEKISPLEAIRYE